MGPELSPCIQLDPSDLTQPDGAALNGIKDALAVRFAPLAVPAATAVYLQQCQKASIAIAHSELQICKSVGCGCCNAPPGELCARAAKATIPSPYFNKGSAASKKCLSAQELKSDIANGKDAAAGQKRVVYQLQLLGCTFRRALRKSGRRIVSNLSSAADDSPSEEDERSAAAAICDLLEACDAAILTVQKVKNLLSSCAFSQSRNASIFFLCRTCSASVGLSIEILWYPAQG